MNKFLLILLLTPIILAQRSPYAGSRPNGYRDKYVPQAAQGVQTSTADTGLINRAGDENSVATGSTTTRRIPVQAMGDIDAYNLLSQRPIEQQPFWLINYQQIEAHKQQPQLQTGPVATRGHFAGGR